MTTRKILSWAAAFLWMALIFFLSNQPASESSELSSGVTEVILAAAEKIIPEAREHVDAFHHIIRKNAHFTIYLVLGGLAWNALKKSSVSGYKASISALVICFIYAMSDEFHQMFVPGRGPALMDVFIDSSGAATGIGLCLAMNGIASRKKQSNDGKKSFNKIEISKN